MHKSMKEIAAILDDVIEPNNEPLQKALSFNPADIQMMTEGSAFYNPYRSLPDGSFFPHPREYWTSLGKDPEGYQNVYEHYRDAGHYRKSFDSLKDKVDEILQRAEIVEEPKGIKRDAFLYMEPKRNEENFAQCASCPNWTRDKCLIHGPDVEVNEDMSCNFFIPGSPRPEMAGQEVVHVTPEESGLMDATTRCETCTYMDHANKVCKLYQRLNMALSETFVLDENVELRGSCNAWIGTDRGEIQKHG